MLTLDKNSLFLTRNILLSHAQPFHYLFFILGNHLYSTSIRTIFPSNIVPGPSFDWFYTTTRP